MSYCLKEIEIEADNGDGRQPTMEGAVIG